MIDKNIGDMQCSGRICCNITACRTLGNPADITGSGQLKVVPAGVLNGTSSISLFTATFEQTVFSWLGCITGCGLTVTTTLTQSPMQVVPNTGLTL